MGLIAAVLAGSLARRRERRPPVDHRVPQRARRCAAAGRHRRRPPHLRHRPRRHGHRHRAARPRPARAFRSPRSSARRSRSPPSASAPASSRSRSPTRRRRWPTVHHIAGGARRRRRGQAAGDVSTTGAPTSRSTSPSSSAPAPSCSSSSTAISPSRAAPSRPTAIYSADPRALRDGADARPLRAVGLGPRPRPHVLVALDVRDRRPCEPRDDLLGFGEVGRLIHPDDGDLMALAESLYDNGRSHRRPHVPHAPRRRPLDLAARPRRAGRPRHRRAAPHRHRRRRHRADAPGRALEDRRHPPARRDRDHLRGLRPLGRRQPAGDVQLEVPAAARHAGRGARSPARPMPR